MQLTADDLLGVLKAIGEETRLRIVAPPPARRAHRHRPDRDPRAVQPRISRHLKLLADAGVVDKHREGTWAFFDLIASGPIGATDRRRARQHRPARCQPGRRPRPAQRGPGPPQPPPHSSTSPTSPGRWDESVRSTRPTRSSKRRSSSRSATPPYRSVLDLGTGTGRMLQLLGADTDQSRAGRRPRQQPLDARRGPSQPRAGRAPSCRSTPRRHLQPTIRTRLVRPRRHAPGAPLPRRPGPCDPRGRLACSHRAASSLIVDFAPHSLEFLRTDHAHRRLGLRHDDDHRLARTERPRPRRHPQSIEPGSRHQRRPATTSD